jgi:hypothetical protein
VCGATTSQRRPQITDEPCCADAPQASTTTPDATHPPPAAGPVHAVSRTLQAYCTALLRLSPWCACRLLVLTPTSACMRVCGSSNPHHLERRASNHCSAWGRVQGGGSHMVVLLISAGLEPLHVLSVQQRSHPHGQRALPAGRAARGQPPQVCSDPLNAATRRGLGLYSLFSYPL